MGAGFVWGSDVGESRSGVVAGNWQKKEEKGELCLGGKHCALHSVLKGRQGWWGNFLRFMTFRQKETLANFSKFLRFVQSGAISCGLCFCELCKVSCGLCKFLAVNAQNILAVCVTDLETDEELTKKELKQVEANDQAIQTTLLSLPEEIYVATKDLHEVDYTQLYDFLKMNQEENVENQIGYNVVHNAGNPVVHNAVQNLGFQNVRNHNGLIVVLGIANPNANQNGNSNVVAARADGNGELDKIKEVNANCILMAKLQQASTSGTQTDNALVYDLDGLVEFLKEAAKFVQDFKSLANEANESLAKHKALEFEIEHLLRAVVSQDIMSVENEYAKLWNDWYKKCEECKYDKISYDKAYNDMQQKIKWLQAQLGDFKGKRVDITTKTKRPRPRSNTKNDRVPSASKSSCVKNKEVEVEEHHRNLLLSKNKKHMSSKCNNVKLAIRNDKSEFICAMCHLNLFMVRRLGMLKACDKKFEASHKFRLEDLGNCSLWK
nr:Gag-Pol polyprotein [Tanacetum cinerariifolium]